VAIEIRTFTPIIFLSTGCCSMSLWMAWIHNVSHKRKDFKVKVEKICSVLSTVVFRDKVRIGSENWDLRISIPIYKNLKYKYSNIQLKISSPVCFYSIWNKFLHAFHEMTKAFVASHPPVSRRPLTVQEWTISLGAMHMLSKQCSMNCISILHLFIWHQG